MPGVSKVQEVEKILQSAEAILCTLKENLVMAQNRMKQQADQGHSECQFVEGDQVFLRLQPYKKTSLKVEHCQKLASQILWSLYNSQVSGASGLPVSFPSHSKLHLVFHVSCLKKVIGTKCQTQTSLPELDEEGSIWFAATSSLGPARVSSLSVHHQGSVSSVEGYNSRRCHLGADYHSATISSSQALRTRLFFKGEGMLGT
jgi:hypothetical protein